MTGQPPEKEAFLCVFKREAFVALCGHFVTLLFLPHTFASPNKSYVYGTGVTDSKRCDGLDVRPPDRHEQR